MLQVFFHLIQFHAERLSLRRRIPLFEAEDFGQVASRRLNYNGLDLLQSLVLFFVMLDVTPDLLHILLGDPLLVLSIGQGEVIHLVAILDLKDAMLLVMLLFELFILLQVQPILLLNQLSICPEFPVAFVVPFIKFFVVHALKELKELGFLL